MIKIKISEIFKSLQGEIDNKPAVFVRVSGCNLIKEGKGCQFCDTVYAESGKEMKLENIIKEVRKYKKDNNVIFTGGEPVSQIDNIVNLMAKLQQINHEYKFDIETNGTIYDKKLKCFDHINCSPKKQALDLTVLKDILQHNYDRIRFKFVYENKQNKWWERVVNKINIPNNLVYIMPEGKTKTQQLKKMNEVTTYCVRKNYNFVPRVHVLLYGSKKGV